TDHEVERATGQSKSDQHAGGEIERAGVWAACHQREAERIKHGAGDDHAVGAETIGDAAGEWLSNTPEQILDGECHRKYFAAPVEFLGYRRQEKAQRGPRPKSEHRDQATADDDHGRRAPPDRGWAVSRRLWGHCNKSPARYGREHI